MTKKQREQAFFNKPVWKLWLFFSGASYQLHLCDYPARGLYSFVGQPVTPPVGAAVMVGSAADKSGFQPHDKIISIDGNSAYSFDDIRREMAIALDEERLFVVERNGKEVEIYASPTRQTLTDRFGFQHSRGLLGLLNPRHAVKIETIKTIDGRTYSDETRSQSVEPQNGARHDDWR